MTNEQLNDIARAAFERYNGRPHPWEGAQDWVLAAMRDAVAARAQPEYCNNGCRCLAQCGGVYAHEGKPKPAQHPVSGADGLSVAWEIRSKVSPASVELTPFVARAQEAWQQGFEVHDLVRRANGQPKPSGNAGDFPKLTDAMADAAAEYIDAHGICIEPEQMEGILSAALAAQAQPPVSQPPDWIRNAVLEEAAQACEQREARASNTGIQATCRLCAKDIRALKSSAVVNQSLTTDDLPPLPKGYIVQMTPDPDSTPAEWFDETDMREYARAALAQQAETRNRALVENQQVAQQASWQDREDAERWREFIKGHAVECHGTRPNGSKWSYFLGYRLDKLEGWKERFTEAIDAARAAGRE